MAAHFGSFPDPTPPRGPEPERVTNTRRDARLTYAGLGGDPDPEPIPVTEARQDFVASPVVRTSVPFPEPEPDFTRSRTENASSVAVSTSSLEPDTEEISKARRNDITAIAWFSAETPVRGESDETKSRGELAYTAPTPESTGTFARGETDYDPRLLGLFDTASTLTHSDRGDSDDNVTALYDISADDPADRRRITPLGVIAARQDAALSR